jgi:myo-inositol-1(or 4)-monophosphatase
MRKSGSAALDLAYVAAGRYDGYFQKNIKLWDIAAGIILILEAGGQINKIDLENNNIPKIIASGSIIYEELVRNLNNF